MLREIIDVSLVLLRKIPYIGALFDHKPADHFECLAKLFYLWLFATLPVLVSVAFSQVPTNGEDPWLEFIKKISVSFSLREQFVYTASFVAPILYISIDNIKRMKSKDGTSRFETIVRNVPSGFRLINVTALLMLLVAAAAHAFVVSGADATKTYFYYYANQYSLAIYGFAIYLWYISLLDEKMPKDVNYSAALKNGATKAAQNLAERLAARRESDVEG